MAFAIGNTVGPYRIVDQIGQGGMATVYKAYHANLDRYVAFKVLHPAFKQDPSFLERFKREAQIVAKLEHPAIVPVYDFAAVGGQPYLVMKFIEGETLKARLKRQSLTLAETIKTLEVVASALSYAHEQGILHRDIKPSNIMLDNQGTPYIADFGLARIAQAGESTLSQDMMLGTPQYISPEQAQGIRDLGPGTDIYSLGVVLYEIVVGRVPFSADTPYAIVHDHIYKPLPMPSKVNPEVPAEVERVLLKALSKDSQDRYATAVDMVEAFREAVDESQMTELTVTRYRAPEPRAVQPEVPTAATAPPQPAEPVSPSPVPAYVAIPSPVIQSTADSAISQQAYRRRANLWILGGIGSVLVLCLSSLFILLKAVSEWDDINQVDAGEESVEFDISANMPLEDAQRKVDKNPDDPRSYIALAAAEEKVGNRNAALEHMLFAIDELGVTTELLVVAAHNTVKEGFIDVPIWLSLELLTRNDVDAEARNEAERFLLDRLFSDPPPTREAIEMYLTHRPEDQMQHLVLIFADISLREAEKLVAEQPDDPLAHLALAIAQVKHGDREAAFKTMVTAVDQLGASSELLAAMARYAAHEGYDELAIWLSLEALSHDRLSPDVRNETGFFLFEYAQSNPGRMAIVIRTFVDTRPANAFVYTMQAWALLNTRQDPDAHPQAWNSINRALRLDDSLAEIYLIRGVYHRSEDRIDEAIANWEKVLNADDTPEWARRVAETMLTETQLQFP